MGFEKIPIPNAEGFDDEKDNKKESGPKIKLPEDKNILRVLEIKLEEYKKRLDSQREKDYYKAPERFADTNYKIFVLEKLLKEGEVDTYALSIELMQKDGFVDAQTFENACGVIEDYAKTGGENVGGGTGLKIERDNNNKEGVKEILVKNVSNFDELFAAIDLIGEIQGSQQRYTPETLKEIINKVRNENLGINYVTQIYGLRDKVGEMMNKK